MAPQSKTSLAGPLHLSYPIKAPQAYAFQLQSEIYCPLAGLIRQGRRNIRKKKKKKEKKKGE